MKQTNPKSSFEVRLNAAKHRKIAADEKQAALIEKTKQAQMDAMFKAVEPKPVPKIKGPKTPGYFRALTRMFANACNEGKDALKKQRAYRAARGKYIQAAHQKRILDALKDLEYKKAEKTAARLDELQGACLLEDDYKLFVEEINEDVAAVEARLADIAEELAGYDTKTLAKSAASYRGKYTVAKNELAARVNDKFKSQLPTWLLGFSLTDLFEYSITREDTPKMRQALGRGPKRIQYNKTSRKRKATYKPFAGLDKLVASK